ncbi:hypothetical protein NHP200010_15080 [Helicobacter bizzozeronii]|uniref:hypothetical protein n=1 Tax=Helicobacter bizzozeronii TaxID=56877 RepID=UPI0013155043|nr:hypothetical protein [Helicobacter bizzozeronii]GMB93777.1 hypothetical protein NHP200010_15080 [Helicobacter bizzozeronii]
MTERDTEIKDIYTVLMEVQEQKAELPSLDKPKAIKAKRQKLQDMINTQEKTINE